MHLTLRHLLRLGVLISYVAAISSPALAQRDIKMMTYNVRNAVGMDDVRNYQRIANAILAQQPEVVAIQELDSATKRSELDYVLGQIATRTNMHPIYAPAIEYDGGRYGIGILARKEPISVSRHALPGREEKRAMVVAEFDDFVFACTHLSLTDDDRMASLGIIERIANETDKPFFIAGDLNATPDSPEIERLKQNFTILSNSDAHTFPASNPTETIDYIATHKRQNTPAVVRLNAQVINEPIASDHRPIVVMARIATPADKILRTAPYLQNPSSDAITVMWETSVPSYCWIEYGTDTTSMATARTLVDGQAMCNNTIHKIRLSDLTPGKRYFYRINSCEITEYKAYHKKFGNTYTSELHSFELPTASDDTFTALIFNDIHQQTATFNALQKQIEKIDYDFVIFNGDVVDDPINRDQASQFIGLLTRGVKAAEVPVFFMRGNHEIRNAYSIGLRDHYDYPGNKTYGAFNWGDTRIVMLDCGEDKPDDTAVYYGLNDFTALRNEQTQFLKLETSSKPFKKADKRILIHHIPSYGDEVNLCREQWLPILSKAPFDIAINAHTHRLTFIPKNSEGNNYPVLIGGGPELDSATVIILNKKPGKLKIKALGTDGKVRFEEEF